jgi:hypothetical protein
MTNNKRLYIATFSAAFLVDAEDEDHVAELLELAVESGGFGDLQIATIERYV